jgi:acyl dehydratase
MSDSLSTLVRGHEYPTVAFRLDRPEIEAYLDAVGDRVSATTGQEEDVPPLAAAAFALRALLGVFHLPEGSVHGSEEVEFVRPPRIGEELRCESRVASASDRQGFRFSTVEQRLVDASGQVVLTARALLMSPLAESAVQP